MKNSLKQVFRSPKFLVGFIVMACLLAALLVYPLINPGDPLEMIGLGSFLKPGVYVSLYDAVDAKKVTIKLSDADQKRIDHILSAEDRAAMLEYFKAIGVYAEEVDPSDTATLLKLWWENYDAAQRPEGMTKATRNYYMRLNNALESAKRGSTLIVAERDEETGELVEHENILTTDYVNTKDVANVKVLPLGTESFGRDVLKELVSATGTSLRIGLIAGTIATLIGLMLGLLAGYVGGLCDDIIMFIINLFTVIPNFVLLLLISYSISQDQRGPNTVALVIGITAWVWTARSVRSQVISLRNRDHVNLSKISGHSLMRIILTDILPYIASYVVMAFILQISSAILAEASLSMIGLGSKTTSEPTLGLMMNWAMLYTAHLNGSWWAYMPALIIIALISFSLNLMNTGLDQVFNPTLRD
ncbi:MAG: ABC transporter permease [Clostridiaceae bacterium]|nr:ABC transporter permease [Eubacteriales bacterium]